MNISNDRLEIIICFNNLTFIPILKQMPDPIILQVIPMHITGTDSLKTLTKGFTFSLHQQMNMITHQTIRQKFVSTLLLVLIQSQHKHLIILCILKYRLLVDPPQNDMINPRFTLQPSRPRHFNHPLKRNTHEKIIPFFSAKRTVPFALPFAYCLPFAFCLCRFSQQKEPSFSVFS